MNYQDVFIQILHEVSGKPKAELTTLLETIKRVHPGGKWDKKLTDDEAANLLAKLRTEKGGIRRWLAEGAATVQCFESSTKH